jgi:glutamate/aspartate transport system substrate-binding protein
MKMGVFLLFGRNRDSSIPLSYLDDKLLPVGFSIELCKHVVEAVKAKLAMPSLKGPS